jgi:aspartate/methionine/tyrosine aminotransferase
VRGSKKAKETVRGIKRAKQTIGGKTSKSTADHMFDTARDELLATAGLTRAIFLIFQMIVGVSFAMS